jgi:hypothetical protein
MFVMGESTKKISFLLSGTATGPAVWCGDISGISKSGRWQEGALRRLCEGLPVFSVPEKIEKM